MEWVKAVEIMAALIGLLGIYCIGKYISDVFFLPGSIVTAVTVFDDESLKNADILMHTLKRGIWRMADRRICVFVLEKYSTDPELINIIVSVGAEYFIVKEI